MKNTLIIAIANQKGGVGKTTTALATIEGLTTARAPVLAIDLDGQTSLTAALEGNADAAGIIDLIEGTDAAAIIQHSPRADLIAGSVSLFGSEADGEDIAEAIRRAAAPYRYCVIDTPPSISPPATAAILAADFIVIPTTLDADAINVLLALIGDIAHLGKSGSIAGILPIGINARTNYTKTLLRQLSKIAEDAGTSLFEAIPTAQSTIQTARLLKKPLLTGKAGKSKAGIAYNAYINQLKRRMKK